MKRASAIVIALAWAAWILGSAAFLDTYRPNEPITALGVAVFFVDFFGTFPIAGLAIWLFAEGSL